MIGLAAWFNETVVWLNMAGATVAAIALFLAAKDTTPQMRPRYAASCALAVVYALSYGWLAINPGRSAEWSEVMRPISMVTWWVVWTAPALASRSLWKSKAQ